MTEAASFLNWAANPGGLAWFGPVLVAVGGGMGAVSRYALSQVIDRKSRSPLPVGTMLVNIAGSFLIGFLAAALPPVLANTATLTLGIQGVEQNWGRLLLVTGFCGGFTTFSTATVDAVRLARSGQLGLAVRSIIVTLIAASAAVVVGGLAGSQWSA